ncbi:permease [Devosia sp. Leaf64]|uniref:permease n=1 Tax=Devosia sp. Leaf64 TaxID=1736229 RepID=UPI0007156905|nr:permease [Devosia sp. Leaf64]KQN73465.1 hypothetical protein ASE94_06425 [Devosia sp. Leaf64]
MTDTGKGTTPSPKAAGKKSGAWIPQAAGFVAVAIATGVLCYVLQGEDAVVSSLRASADQFGGIIVDLVCGLVMAACIGALLPKEKVARWLGEESGWRGLFVAIGLGILMPGGPFASFPLVLALSKAGADMGALIAFLTAWGALSASRVLIWEIPLLGSDFVLTRLLVTLPLPLMAGLIARFIVARTRKASLT